MAQNEPQVVWHEHAVSREDRERLNGHRGCVVWFTGLSGSGKSTPKEEQQKDVTILDMMSSSATVKLEMRDWVDYMHIGKMNGKWVIVNVLWEMKPKKDEKKN